MGRSIVPAPHRVDSPTDEDAAEVLVVARRMQQEGLIRVVFDASGPLGWDGRWRFFSTEYGERWFALREQGMGYEEATIAARSPFVPRTPSSYKNEAD